MNTFTDDKPGARVALGHSPSAEPFVLGFYTEALLGAFLDQGGLLDTLARACKKSVTWLCQPPEKISVDDYLELMSCAESILGDKCFGLHVGQQMQAAGFDILGQAMLKAETLGQATQQVLALESLVHSLGYSQVLQEPGHLRFVWHCHYQMHPLAAQISTSVLAGIIHFGQHLAGRPMPVMEMTFRHEIPNISEENTLAEYRRVCSSTCLFGQEYNSILVAEDVLGWPVNTGKLTVLRKTFPSQSRSALDSDFWSNQLGQYFEYTLADGSPSLAAASRHFHISVRTLQRRLAEEGTTFQNILNEVRNSIALDYLRYSRLSILEVSQMLGFTEQSSFNHFFLAQQAVSPGVFRQRG